MAVASNPILFPVLWRSSYEPSLARMLRFVAQAGSVRIYEVPNPRPLAPGADVVRRHDSLTLRVAGPGTLRLAIRGNDGGWRRLRVPRAGAVTVTFP